MTQAQLANAQDTVPTAAEMWAVIQQQQKILADTAGKPLLDRLASTPVQLMVPWREIPVYYTFSGDWMSVGMNMVSQRGLFRPCSIRYTEGLNKSQGKSVAAQCPNYLDCGQQFT